MPPLILHIDESPDLPAGVAETLAEDGYELRRTADPEEAMRLVGECSPSLVLMEIQLAGCEGSDLMAGICDSKLGSVPMLVVTTTPRDSPLHSEAIALGVVDFLTKPVAAGALLDAIHEIVPPPGRTAPLREPATADLSGDLAETPMPELLARLRRRGANGLLAVGHGETRVGLQLRNGSPVGISSSRKAPFAEAALYETFRWEAGRFGFSEGRWLESDAILELAGDPAGMLLAGVLDVSPTRQIRQRLAKRESLYVSVTDEPESALEAEGVRFTRAQRELLGNLGGETTLSVLLDSDAFEDRLVYALWVAGWLELQTAPTLSLTELLGDTAADPPELAEPTPRRDEHKRELARMQRARAERELAELAQSRKEQEQELRKLARTRERRLQELAELERAREEREREHEALAPALEERAQELEQLGRTRERRARELATLARARKEHEQELQELVRARKEREREQEALAPALEESARALEELTKARAERSRELEALARAREEHEHELEELECAREQHARKLAALAPALEERSRELEALERARGELAREVAALARIRDEHERELEELVREREQLTQQPEPCVVPSPGPAKAPSPMRREAMPTPDATVPTGPPPPVATPAEPEAKHGEIALIEAPAKADDSDTIVGSLRALATRALTGDDFQALGIAHAASDAEVRAAYEGTLQAIPEFDPTIENLVHTQQAKRIRGRIEAAYSNLRSDDKRRAYSLLREEEEQDRKAKPSAERALEGERWFRKGNAYLEQKQCDKAVEAFGMAAHLDPEQGEYASHLGYALYLSNPTDEVVQREAMEHLASGIKRAPRYELAYLYLGRIHKSKGDIEVAKKIFRRALRFKPDFHPIVQELRVLEMRERSGKGVLSRLIGR